MGRSVALKSGAKHLGSLYYLEGAPPHCGCHSRRCRRRCSRIDAVGSVDWREVAHRAGFYDQAHFGNELRAFTGTTPTQ